MLKDLVQESLLLAEKDHSGKEWSLENYPRGFTSYGSLDQLHKFSSTFEALAKRLQPALKEFLTKTHLDIAPRDLELSRMWVNVMGTGSSHAFHLHPHSVVSGSCYLQMPAGAPGIKFEDPRIGSLMIRPQIRPKARPEFQNYITLRPLPGQVVLFESWVKHEVPPHHGKSPRISVSFNFDWKRS